VTETNAGPAGDGGNNSGTTPPADGGFKPITSQEDLNRVIADRISRERGKYADYDDLRAKAARLAEIEEANKSEAQKLADAKAAAERDRDVAKAEALRLRIATKHGISDEDADLFLTGTDEATLTKQAERLAQRAEDRKKNGNHVPREGTNTNSKAASDELAFVRDLFGSGG
jgi:hypothetical protein